MRLSVRAILATLAAGTVAWACSKSTEPSTNTISVTPAASFTFHAINDQVTLNAKLLDKNGDSVPGTRFNWSSSNTSVATVSAFGVLIAKANGTATVTVSGGGTSKDVPVTVAQTPVAAAKTGDDQLAAQGSVLTQPITVILADSAGFPVTGETVSFSIMTGGGSVSPANPVSDASGHAKTTWTMGSGSTIQTVSATVNGTNVAVFTGNSVPPTKPGFQIMLVNAGPPFSPAVQTAFDSAIAFWQRAIVGDLYDTTGFSIPAGACFNSTTLGPFTLDDVVIVAVFDSIDGHGKILGASSPCVAQRAAGSAPTFAGAMKFDTADVADLVASGLLNQVIRHEMGHVLGFGTFWGNLGCLQNAVPPTSQDTYFSCPLARAYFDSIGGTTYTQGLKVPVENCGAGAPPGCGQGTQNGHWRENYTNDGAPHQGQPLFGTELMSGYLNPGVPNPVSKVTLASLADLGYTVNINAAETFTTTFAAPPQSLAQALGLPQPLVSLGNDIANLPLIRQYHTRAHGRIVAQ